MKTAGTVSMVIRIAACDFRLTMKERSVVLWIFVMPVAFMVFFGLSFGRESKGAPRARLTIENRDGGFLSFDLIEALRSESLSVVDSLSGRENAVRTLIIPEDFTRSVLDRKRVRLILSKEEGTSIEAGEAVQYAVFRCLVRIVTGLIEMESGLIDQGGERFTVRADSVYGSLWSLMGGEPGGPDTLQVRIDSLLARTPPVSVTSASAGKGSRIPGGFQASVPGNLVMFVLMSMLFSGIAVTIERASGLLRRLGTTPAGRTEVIVGKLLGRMMVAAIQILFLLAVGRLAFGISLGSDPVALVSVMLAFAFCVGSFSLLFGALFSNPDQVAGFAVITTLVMSALGGCWWPIEIVSRPFQMVALFLPTGWALSGLHRVISFGFGLKDVVVHIGVLCAFGVVFVAVASRKLKWTV